MKKILKDKVFLSTMFALALPITIQSFITSSLNLVDNVMVGRLGEEAIASVGLANQYIFIFTLCILGINAGASIFMSQFWGKKDTKSIKTILGLDITVGFIATLLFGLAALIFPTQIMGILSTDTQVIELGASYLRIVSISCLFTNFTQAYSSALRSTGQTKVPMYASLVGVLSNAFLNWIFIFGKFGVPAMGVSGAAVATTIARGIEMIYIVGYVYGTKNIISAKINELFNFNIEFVKIYFKTSWSVIANELIYSLGITAYSIAYAQIGTSAVATMQIATTLSNMFMVLLMGVGNAAAIMIGNKIGAGEEETAKQYSKNIGIITPLLGVTLGVALWFVAPIIIAPFNVTQETFADTISVLRVMAIFFGLRAFNFAMIVGVFRGGGDTTYSMVVQLTTVWFYAVPMAFIGAAVLKLPVSAVYFLICTEELIKAVFEIRRLKSGKWLRNVIGDIEFSSGTKEQVA